MRDPFAFGGRDAIPGHGSRLRLVRDDDEREFRGGSGNETHIHIHLHLGGPGVPPAGALAHALAVPQVQPIRADAPSPPQPAVAGRIETTPGTLEAAISGWCDWLKARKKKAGSIAAFRQTVRAGAAACGWRDASDLTFSGVSEYLASKTTWKGATLNRNLSAFRSFTKWAVAAKLLVDDPLLLAVRADADPAEGSRAATTEEARSLLRQAWAATTNDKRAKGRRDVYTACLFLAGCRHGEPELWTWGDLHLFEPIPFILWRPEMHKSRRRQEVALAPELVRILREYRDSVPHEPKDPVFPTVPPRTTFRHDRDRAGIEAKDRRGRGFSPHSTRKWYRTTLAEAGVQDDLCDYVVRHHLTVSARYCDFSLEAQAAALASLPSLWPVSGGVVVAKNTVGRLTDRGRFAEDVSATSSHEYLKDQPDGSQEPAPARGLVATRFEEAGAGFSGPSGGHGEQVRPSRRGREDLTTGKSCSKVPIFEQYLRVDRIWLAETLEIAAGLLRNGAGDVGERSKAG